MNGEIIQVKERPVIQTAIQWTGSNREEMMSFLGESSLTVIAQHGQGDVLKYPGLNSALRTVKPGEWLVQTYSDETYPSPSYGLVVWTDREFKQRYEQVVDYGSE